MVGIDKLMNLNGSTERVVGQIYADSAEPINLYAKEISQESGSKELNYHDYSDLLTESTYPEADFEDTYYNYDPISTLASEPTVSEEATESKRLNISRRSIYYDSPNFSLSRAISDGFNLFRNSFPSKEKKEITQTSYRPPGFIDLAISGLKSGMEMLIPSGKPTHDHKISKPTSKTGHKNTASNHSDEPRDDTIYAQSALCFDMTNLSIDDKRSVAFKSSNHVDYQSSVSTDSKQIKSSKKEVEKNNNFEHFKESISSIMKNQEEVVYLEYISKLMSVTDGHGNT